MLAVVTAGFLIISLIKIEPALVTTRKELNNLDKKIAEIKQSTSELKRLGGYLNIDAYFERQARLKLNYKKPDEKVVYIYTRENNNKTEPPTSLNTGRVTESELIQNLKLWWWYLVGK